MKPLFASLKVEKENKGMINLMIQEDKVIICEEEYQLLSNPLEEVLKEGYTKYLKYYTGEEKSYVATWKIEMGALFLVGFHDSLGNASVHMKDKVVNRKDMPLKADWVTGNLLIPITGLAQCKYSEYKAVYPKLLVVSVEQGCLVSINFKCHEFTEKWDCYSDDDKSYIISNVSSVEITEGAMYQMLYDVGEYLYSDNVSPFSFEFWEPELKEVKAVLEVLNKHKDIMSALGVKRLITPEMLLDKQKEWIKLYSSYTDQEKAFFRSYWLPIDETGLDYFIDISDGSKPLFCVNFNSIVEPNLYEMIKLFNTMESGGEIVDPLSLDIEKIKAKERWSKYEYYIYTGEVEA